ncbi:MAG: potassium channel family protein [Kofleriaceae bacterium]|nr:potassium channel family protein [Kofleriaceae bacterium]
MIVVLGEAKITGALVAELGQRGAHVVHAPSAARHSIAAAMAQATVVVLTDNDDSTNVDLALELRRELPTVRLVVRLFDHALGRFLSSTMNKLTVLSLSELASPLLVRAVLAAQMPDGTRQASLSRLAALTPLAAVRNRNTGQLIVWLILGLFTLVVPFALYFMYALKIRFLDALYFVWTTIMTVGYGDISLREASAVAKVMGMVLMFAGATFMAILFALITGWFIGRRLNAVTGRVQVHARNHVVIAGGGNVGYRVAVALRQHNFAVVVIEANPHAQHAEALRSQGCHVILADASEAQTLRLAGVVHARTVVALTDADAVNLQVGLVAAALNPSAAQVMRLESAALSAHVSGAALATAISPVSIAVGEFANAAMGAEQA